MKRLTCITTLCVFIAGFAPLAHGALTIPGANGSDGALNVTSNTIIDLSMAVTGVWDANNAANAGKGIYDASKWAVVFKYSSVNIAAGTMLSFKNHLTHAPVVWLVNGNVRIDGFLDLQGQEASTDPATLPEPGPGGFRGGARAQAALSYSGGFGPGGYYRDNGGYADYNAYGNPQIVPLIGGSGGSGAGNEWNGGAGGGAILIAASGTTTLSGSGIISVYGGYYHGAWAGSGGAVRLVADQILGSGRIEAGSTANRGRIRLEANTASPLLSLNPPIIAVPPSPLVIWPDASAPTVKVISVAGRTAPPDPKAVITANGDDVIISTNAVSTIRLETANFPTNGIVNVYIKPRNESQTILPASYVSGTPLLATWEIQTALPVGHTVIQARAVVP